MQTSQNTSSRNCPKRGVSNAPNVDWAVYGGQNGPKTQLRWPLKGYVASASETFRTVSLGRWVNKGKKRKGQVRLDRPRYQPYQQPPDPVHN
jgi:hypothetical protein